MSVKFDFFQSPTADPGSDQKKLHARVVPSGTASTRELAGEISRAASLTEGDVYHAVMELTYQIGEHLANGESVHIDGLGFFQLTLSVPENCDEKTRAEHVSVKSVSFRPDKALRERLSRISTIRSDRKVHSNALTDAQITNLLKSFFKGQDSISSSQFMKLVGMTASTANRRMKQLLKEGKLENKGTKYRPYYIAGKLLG